MNKKEPILQIKKELPRGLIISSFIAIFFVLFLLPFISWLLEYKDTINAPLTITTKTTPVDVYAERAGKLVLLVENNEQVEKGQALAMLENTADYKDIKCLNTILNQANQAPLAIAKSLTAAGDLKVGEMQAELINVAKTMEDYRAFLNTDQHKTLISSRLAQIAILENRKKLFEKKGIIIEKDQSYVETGINRQRELLKDGVIAPDNFEKSDREKLINEKASLDNKTLINNLKLDIQKLKQENIEVSSKFDKEKLNLMNTIKESLERLKNKRYKWELDNLIKANINARCVFKEYLNSYRFVEEKEKIFSLIPDETAEYFAMLQLPMQGASKVQNGQEVYVKLNNYPFMEFGVLKGEVSDISTLPFEAHYNVQVNFPNGFTSTYDTTFALTPLMHGIGEIIVDRKTLWNRIGDQVKSVRLNR